MSVADRDLKVVKCSDRAAMGKIDKSLVKILGSEQLNALFCLENDDEYELIYADEDADIRATSLTVSFEICDDKSSIE